MKILTDDFLIKKLTADKRYSEAARRLLETQKLSWEMLGRNYESLEDVKIKSFLFDNYVLKVQYNPARYSSSSAKVDEKSVSERKCFLCSTSLPPEQRGFLHEDKYIVLVNPFPIFDEHFTIVRKNHTPQRIENSFGDLLSLSKDFSEFYTIIYNGPKCGASAPDHLHFQAGNKYFMPVDDEFIHLKKKYGKSIADDEKKDIRVMSIDDNLRKMITLESGNKDIIEKAFSIFFSIYKEINPDPAEPMMNIISFYEEETGWRIIIFLRSVHRPFSYYAAGDDNILWSPAAVDLGGTCIVPLQKDYNAISKDTLIRGFREITIPDEKFSYISRALSDKISLKLV